MRKQVGAVVRYSAPVASAHYHVPFVLIHHTFFVSPALCLEVSPPMVPYVSHCCSSSTTSLSVPHIFRLVPLLSSSLYCCLVSHALMMISCMPLMTSLSSPHGFCCITPSLMLTSSSHSRLNYIPHVSIGLTIIYVMFVFPL